MTITGWKAGALVAALIVSICLNVFAAAATIGRFAFHGQDRQFGRGVPRFLASAPEAAQPVLQAAFEQHREEINARMAALREARRNVAQLLRTPDADSRAIADAFAELRARDNAAQTLIHETLVEAVTKLPPDVRGQWAPRWGQPR